MTKDIDICWKCFEKVLTEKISNHNGLLTNQTPLSRLEEEFRRLFKLGYPPTGINFSTGKGWHLSCGTFLDCDHNLCPYQLELLMKESC